MDAIAFARRVLSESDDPTLDRWADNFSEVVATHALHLARFVDRMSEPLRQEYIALVRTLLGELPEGIDITVSQGLYQAIAKLGDDTLMDEFASRIMTPK